MLFEGRFISCPQVPIFVRINIHRIIQHCNARYPEIHLIISSNIVITCIEIHYYFHNLRNTKFQHFKLQEQIFFIQV